MHGRRVGVIGGGPVGMTCALLLAARGVPVLLIEARPGPSDEPKAISIDDEALRTYAQAGVLDDVLRIIVPGLGTRYYGADGEPMFLARAAAPGALGFPFKNPFAQPDLERVLHDAIEQHPLVDARFGHRLVRLEQRADDVLLGIEGADGGDETVAYLVGADGGRSAVRSAVGIGMTGRSHPDAWLVVDTLRDPHDQRYGMHFGVPGRPHVIVPGLRGRCRYEFRLFAGEGEPGETPDFALIRELVRPYRDIEPEDVERAVAYRFHGLNAARYRSGRVLLAGDAAHMMPPFAGQGLNSGIRDAANLTWKLAEIVQGRMPDRVLDSYDDERRPQAEAVIALSERLGRVVMTTSERVAAYRDTVVRGALATERGRRYFEHMEYRPSTAFSIGLFVGASPAGSALQQPQVYDVDASRMVRLDEVTGEGWAVLGIDVDEADWCAVQPLQAAAGAVSVHVPIEQGLPRSRPAARVAVDYDGSLERVLGGFAGGFLLVRPDHVIAATWRPSETERITRRTAAWFLDRAQGAPDHTDHDALTASTT